MFLDLGKGSGGVEVLLALDLRLGVCGVLPMWLCFPPEMLSPAEHRSQVQPLLELWGFKDLSPPTGVLQPLPARSWLYVHPLVGSSRNPSWWRALKA